MPFCVSLLPQNATILTQSCDNSSHPTAPEFFKPMRISILLLLIAFQTVGLALDKTAVLTGPWSSASTWGGVLPGAEDDVIIPAGITVTLNTNVECGGISVGEARG